MKTMNICTEKSGYYYNRDNGKLEAYELKSIRVNFSGGDVRYICTLGGLEDMTLDDENLCIYATEEDFKRDNFVRRNVFNFNEVFSLAKGFHPIQKDADSDERFVWYWSKEGVAKEINVEHRWLEYNAENKEWSLPDSSAYYASREQVYLHHDYIVKQADGTEVVRKSPKSLLALTDEQRKVVEQISGLMKQAKELNVQIIVDDCSREGIFAYNTAHVDNVDLWEENDGHIEAMNLVERFYSGNVWAVSEVQYLQVKFKDDTPSAE